MRLMDKVRVLIADDEPLAREELRTSMQQHPRVQIVGELATGCELIDAIDKLSPHLLFLDIEMPGLNPFQVLERIDRAKISLVVLVGPHQEYVPEAFKMGAFGYLSKPVSRDRIMSVLDRACVQIDRSTIERFEGRLDDIFQHLKRQEERAENGGAFRRIVIKRRDRISFVEAAEIDWIEACGNYINLHVGKRKHLLKESMNNIESKLNGLMFLRIRRSTIVNMKSVKEFRPLNRGRCVVLMKDNTKLFSSRRFRCRIQQFLR
jgi:two-component system LytT family response regulator